MDTENIQASGLPEPSAVESSVMAILRHWEELAARPATDEQLARIWPPWNALPDKMLPEEKCWILTFDQSEQPHPQPARGAHLKQLRQRFDYLPLEKHEYHQALNRACRWSTLTKFVQTTFGLHQNLVARQSAFADADSHASGRGAIFRVANELRLLRPGFLEQNAPTLTDIAHLENRYAAYSRAREEALNALADLVFKVPGMRTGEELPFEEQALGVPHPPTDVPRHLFLARLDALGICSPERLKEFLRDELSNLSREKRQEFYRMSLKPRHGKEPYASLRVWLLENRPVFEYEEFLWQWSDVQAEADEKGIDCPRTSLKQWASRNRLGLRLKRGPAKVDDSRIARSKPLLTTAPVFGHVLKSDSV